MAQKINYGTINEKSVEMLSNFHLAHLELRSWNEWKKEEIAKIEKKMEEVKANRKAELEKGKTADEVTRMFSLEECYVEQNRILNEYDEKTKPHKESMKESLGLISDHMYYAYVLSSTKGLDGKGTIELKAKKSTTKVVVEKSLIDHVHDFLEDLGCSNVDNETAMRKACEILALNSSGLRIMSKGEDYVGLKTIMQFKKLFMYNFLQYVIRDRKVIVVNDDGTLSMREFEYEEPKAEEKEESTENVDSKTEKTEESKKMTIADLKAILDNAKIEYNKKAKKAELEELVKNIKVA